jgi:hypothetical protein
MGADSARLVELAENEAVGFGVRVARKAGRACILDCVLHLVICVEPLETPTSRIFVEVGVFDHHIDSATVALEDDSVLLLSLAQFIDDDRAVRKIPRSVSIDGFRVREDVVHSLFALGERSAGQDDSRPHVNPAAKSIGVFHGFGSAQ